MQASARLYIRFALGWNRRLGEGSTRPRLWCTFLAIPYWSRLLVIMSAALAQCVSRKVIGKLEYGDLHRLEVGFAKVSVMQIRNAKRVVLEAHAVSSPSATRK